MNGERASRQKASVELMPFRPFMNSSRLRYGPDPDPITISDFMDTRLEAPLEESPEVVS